MMLGNRLWLCKSTMDELELAEPEIYRQGNRFGVKLVAAPSLHIMKANMLQRFHP